MKSFWLSLKKPIVGLSPMDGVTDQPFRFIQKKYGRPDVIFTEFTSVEGVCHGATRLLKDFLFEEIERPIVAQIYGHTPDYFRQVAIVLCELGFDGIDINMGCPAKNVAHSGSGAALIKTPQLAQQIIVATKAGVGDWVNGKTSADCPDISQEISDEIKRRHSLLPPQYQQRNRLPVSVKTRIGFDRPATKEWITTLLEMEPAVISLHGRTLRQQYGGLANWLEIKKASELVHNYNKNHNSQVLILGNGDVKNRKEATEYYTKFAVDGVLIGRASFGNPFVFKKNTFNPKTNLFNIAIEHAKKYETVYGKDERYNFWPMRKHLGWYVRGLPNARQLRSKLFQTNSAQEVERVMKEFSG